MSGDDQEVSFGTRSRKIAGRLALMSGALIVCLAAAELGARVLPLLPINAIGAVMQRDPVTDHSLRPNSRGRMVSPEYDVAYQVNAWGQRDDDPKPHALLLLGDSFMEGYGVRRGSILADRLDAMGIPTINAGVKSYSPLLEYLYLRHRGLALDPDTVVLFFDLSDPANDEYYSRRLVRDDSGLPLFIRPRELSIPEPRGTFGDWLNRHSVFYAYIQHMALKFFPASHEDIGYAGAALDLDPLFPGRDSIPDTDYARRWDRSFEFLGDIRNLLAEHHIAFQVVLYPYGHEVSPDAWAEGRKGHTFPPGISSRRPETYFLGRAAAESIPVISLWDSFRNHPNPGSLYYTYDGHWTPKGHEVAAQALYEKMFPK